MFSTRDTFETPASFIVGKKGKFISAMFAVACAVACAVALLAVPAAAATLSPGEFPGGAKLEATLTGAAETPPADLTASGTAVLTLNPGLGEICYRITVSNLSAPPVAAHIHVAPVGIPGPIVVPLTAPTSTTGSVQACATGVSRDLVLAILQNPSAYYVNVHTSIFPAGAIRGQLSK